VAISRESLTKLDKPRGLCAVELLTLRRENLECRELRLHRIGACGPHILDFWFTLWARFGRSAGMTQNLPVRRAALASFSTATRQARRGRPRGMGNCRERTRIVIAEAVYAGKPIVSIAQELGKSRSWVSREAHASETQNLIVIAEAVYAALRARDSNGAARPPLLALTHFCRRFAVRRIRAFCNSTIRCPLP
jgi:hypothetical protein